MQSSSRMVSQTFLKTLYWTFNILLPCLFNQYWVWNLDICYFSSDNTFTVLEIPMRRTPDDVTLINFPELGALACSHWSVKLYESIMSWWNKKIKPINPHALLLFFSLIFIFKNDLMQPCWCVYSKVNWPVFAFSVMLTITEHFHCN